MNILELDSFNLADAVKFHDRLNPRLWDNNEHLRTDVRDKLLEIARDFQEFLGVPDLDVKDITISGSNAAYNYTPNSDIDLHLVIDLPEADHSEVYRELFDAKKFQYNAQHNIKIGGYDVELYVQNPNQEHHSQGIYSLLRNNWVSVPKRRKAEIDDISTRSKYEDLAARINDTVDSGNHDSMAALMKKIKAMRQNSLDKHGELGADNLAFKLLRTNGYIKKLIDARNAARDRELSLAELAKPKQRVTYGFAENYKSYFKVPEKPVEEPKEKVFRNANEYEWFKLQKKKQQPEKQPTKESPDGVDPTTKMFLEEPVDESPDGVNPTTAMFVTEDDNESTVREFIDFVADRLGITQMPEIVLHTDPEWSKQSKSFGRYTPETHTLEVNLANRHVMDILRTTAHELVHCRQNQESQLPGEAGATGSRWENQAHAIAGVIMRDYADQNPTMFENASGYIPKNKKEARDPRYSMAVSVDIKPGQVGKEANKLALNTGRNGEPGLLMKSANLREGRMPQPSQGQGKYRDLNKPLGPETPPTMPAGTVKVDVSDVYDWYKLGQHISNLKGLGKHDFGAGPPSTIVSFGDEETEHKFIKDLKATGLDVTDIDPKDPNQPPGMKKIKTDPTYNVAENELAESLLQELQVFEEQDLMEIKMTGKNLAKLARDIKGVKVGLEFEMIVPNTDEPGDSDMEADYDQDERVRDIDDAVNFFDDGDYNSSGQIRRLRDQMYEDYYTWRSEQVDNDWYNGGDSFEYFRDYLDREDPFDEEDAEQEARNELQAQYGDELSGEDFDQMLYALIEEKRESYVQEQWDDQGRNFDDAREEYTEERADDYSEQDWLENQGIRYASDVESNYSGDITWPYYTSSGSDDTDVKQVALNFMNAMGMRSVAVSDSYHGNYERWNGSEWVNIGRNKPDDCFAIEPDGSLEGNESSDAGLEFVSPPIPLEDIGTVMKKVQAWAADNGVYTGKSNKTSIHTNISVPGYDIKNLDYLKAALLLGDEYVLREFDRIGNSYAKPAIEKVRQLVNQKPEKAQELLDKMKSQLNAEASKLLHSGVTDKFTSINTKDNRIEFRSPGGDYLSIIADDPQKMIDTINRMVVTMDAAIDPNKYKEEYQKKLYKMLTGQQSGREARTGAKQEPKKETNDLLNIFSRYAAGELPKAALKSFVRQAQLERKLKKGETGGQKYWWNVQWDNNRRIEVVAGSKEVAKQVAAEEWGVPESQLAGAVVTPLRPYTAPPAGSELERLERQAGVGQQSTPNHNWAIRRRNSGDIVRTFYADDYMTAHRVLQQYKLDHNITDDSLTYGPYNREDQQPAQQPQTPQYELYNHVTDQVIDTFPAQNDEQARTRLRDYINYGEGQSAPGDFAVRRAPVPGSTLDLQRQRAAQAQQPAQQNQGNWGIWIIGNNRFANQPGTYARGAEVPLYRFPSQEAAESWLEQQRAERAGLRTDIEVREIEPTRTPVTDIDLFPDMEADLARARADDATRRGETEYIIFNMNDRSQLTGFRAANQAEAEREAESILRDLNLDPDQYDVRERNARPIGSQQDNWSQDFERRMQQGDAAQGGIVDVAGSEVGQTYNPTGTGSFTGQWLVLDPNNRVIYRFGGVGNSQSDANRIAMAWLQQNPRQMVDGVTVAPEMG